MVGFIFFCSFVLIFDVFFMNYMIFKYLIKILNLYDVLIINFLLFVIDLEILFDIF